MYSSVGVLEYGPGTSRMVLNVDQGIADFYRSLIPKAWTKNSQRHRAHISVVRKITPPDLRAWGKYSGHKIEFQYESEIIWDEKYYWLSAYCERLCDIRVELGLEPMPPWRNKFHITVANRKDHSNLT